MLNLNRQQCFNFIKTNDLLKEQIFAAEGKTYTCCKTELLNQYIEEFQENSKVVEESKSFIDILKNFFRR